MVNSKYSLILAPEYSGVNHLDCTINDLADWNNVLRVRNFDNNIVLYGHSVTKVAMLLAYQSFADMLPDYCMAAIIRLGHGTQIADLNGDESDLKDECHVSSDLLPLTDDEFNSIFGPLLLTKPHIKLDVISDICFAGTSTKSVSQFGPVVDDRFHPISFTGPLSKKYKKSAVSNKSQLLKIGGVILPQDMLEHNACGENQLSYDVSSNGKRRSIYSLIYCWSLINYPNDTAAQHIARCISFVTGYIPSQVPCLIGPRIGRIPL